MAGKIVAVVRYTGSYSVTFENSLRSYRKHLGNYALEEAEFTQTIDIVTPLQKGDYVVVDGGEIGSESVTLLQAAIRSKISEGSLSEEAANRFQVWCLKPDLKLTE